MKLKFFSNDFSSCSETEIAGLSVLEGSKGVVALKQYLLSIAANMRQGNACAKDRGDVSGSGKKPYRQKGTGLARHGSKRSPIWPGGGVVFGPKPRDYSQKINRNVKRLALMRALSDKITSGELFVVEKLTFAEPKTKPFDRMVRAAFGENSVLFVDENFERNFSLASGNIDRVFAVDSGSINAFDVVRHGNIVFSGCAMGAIVARLSKDVEGGAVR
jgi:large subunit ribosomal protein L4